MSNKPTYKETLEASNNGVIVTDYVGRILFINKKAEEILSLDRRKISRDSISHVLPSPGALVLECLKTRRPQLSRHVLDNKISLVVNVTPILRGQETLRSLCSFQKMEEFEDSAKKLESYRQLNKQLEAIFRSSSDGIWVCDCKGKVIGVNQASENLNNIQADEVVGRSIADLVANGFIDRSVTLEVLETKRQVTIMQHVKRANKYLLVTGTPCFDEKGELFLIVVNERDMTQLNAIRDQLEESRMFTEKCKAQLAELSMLELKGSEFFAESAEMKEILRVALKLARLETSNILILGESGTGKGLLAKFIHSNSRRREKPFVQINCAALPEGLLEAELFGYEKGAFTGARQQGKVGLLEFAHEGTLFLDEIGDLPLSLQAKLLKYLDDHEVTRVGGTKSKKIDSIIITATNRDLGVLVKEKRFRKDLYYRLNAFTIKVPPLRARPDDIFDLVNYFLSKYNREYGLDKRISAKALEALQSYPFPGNVRELKNLVKRAVVMSEETILDDFVVSCVEAEMARSFSPGSDRTPSRSLTEQLHALEKEILKSAMTRCSSTREMAHLLRISQPTVVRKMRKHGLSRKPYNNESTGNLTY